MGRLDWNILYADGGNVMAKILLAALLALLAAAPVARAQQGNIVVLDDGISVDREQLRKEHDQLMKLLTEDPQEAMRTGLLRKSDYCLTCKSGLKATCTAPFAGETGKVWCASQCSYKCRGTCGVAANAC
jgi:hypothetical protein